MQAGDSTECLLTKPFVWVKLICENSREGSEPMYTSADLKEGLKVIIDGEPYVVTVFDFSKPGKGQALYRTKLRNMITGIAIDRTYRPGDTFEPALLEEREMQYLYKEENIYHFMDNQTYEQITITEEALGGASNYLKENI